METLLPPLFALLRAGVMPRATLVLENPALRQQLAVHLRTEKRPRLRPGDRVFWVVPRRLCSDWTRLLVIVQPATVIGWHRKRFKLLWRRQSRPGRPRIPRRHINFIRCMSADHPEWGEDKIAEELAAKFGIRHSGSTVRKYMVPRGRPPRGDQTWRLFVRNHAKELWACNFLTQHTVTFTVAYVLEVVEITSRRLVHDNDGIYGQYRARVTVEKDGARRSYRCHLSVR